MRTINIRIPESMTAKLRKFADKTAKNVPGFKVEISQPYDRIYKHITKQYGVVRLTPMWHRVCDVTIDMPDDNNWRLLATFEDGVMFVVDPAHKLEIKNPEHGEDCRTCDVCGHRCNNSYLIINIETGQELQVGCECVKKFGLNMIGWLGKFTAELRRIYNYDGSDSDTDDCWPTAWGSDKMAFRAIETALLITTAKEYYKKNPKWIKGKYVGDVYIKSKSNEDIQDLIWETIAQPEYATAVCDYIKANINASDSEFSAEMVCLAEQYYAQPADAAKAFFMVKAYEDWKATQSEGFIEVCPGNQVYVSGKVINVDVYDGYYGTVITNTIQTPTGRLVSRKGSIPETIKDGVRCTQFYAVVKGVERGEIIVDRALKHPKKGIEVITI